MKGQALPEEEFEEYDHGTRTKKRRRGKKKKTKEVDVTDRDLLMARAYGGLNQT